MRLRGPTPRLDAIAPEARAALWCFSRPSESRGACDDRLVIEPRGPAAGPSAPGAPRQTAPRSIIVSLADTYLGRSPSPARSRGWKRAGTRHQGSRRGSRCHLHHRTRPLVGERRAPSAGGSEALGDRLASPLPRGLRPTWSADPRPRRVRRGAGNPPTDCSNAGRVGAGAGRPHRDRADRRRPSPPPRRPRSNPRAPLWACRATDRVASGLTLSRRRRGRGVSARPRPATQPDVVRPGVHR